MFHETVAQIKDLLPEADPFEVFAQAVEIARPAIEVRSKRVQGITYQVAVQVGRDRQQALSIRRLIRVARSERGLPMAERLAKAIVAADSRCGA